MSYLSAPEPAGELKRLTTDVHSALSTLRDAIESKNENTEKKVRDFLNKYEDLNQKYAREYATWKKSQESENNRLTVENIALSKRIEQLEEAQGAVNYKGASPSWNWSGDRSAPDYRTFWAWATNSRCREFATKVWDGALDLKTLRTDAESAGGYLIPQVMDNAIRKNIIETSPIRMHARVRTSPSKMMDVPRRLSVPIAQFEGESETGPTDQQIYGSEQVTLYRQTVTVPATLDMLVSSAFDLEREIAADVGDSFAQGEGLNFVSGSGRKGPQGLTQDSRVVGYTTASSGTVAWSDFPSMAGKLKRGYNPWWFFNRRTLAYLQSLQSGIGVPIWQPVAGGQPATIWGYPYDAGVIDLDDVATGGGAKPVVFADLMRGYEIFDMQGINVLRDDLTQATKAIIQWIFRRYLTGRVIIPEAIAVMTIKS